MVSLLDMSLLVFELECAVENLNAVHSQMEADGGANWQSLCNALYCTYSHLYNIKKEMQAEIDAAESSSLNDGVSR